MQGTAEQLAEDIGIPIEEINYVCAGINHVAFYLRFERQKGNEVQDLYPEIRRVLEEGRVPDWNRVRYEVFKHLGYFVTESSEHFSEYVPWFIKRDRPDLVENFNVPLDEYITRCETQIAEWEGLRKKLENPEAPLEVERSQEYGSGIIHSMETGQSRVVYGNVPNHGLIDNLPDECIVELPCLVDKNGVQPTRIGALPPQLAAVDADQHQRTVADRGGRAHGQARTYLPRCHARSAHRRRTGSRPDPLLGRRLDRSSR